MCGIGDVSYLIEIVTDTRIQVAPQLDNLLADFVTEDEVSA